MIGHCDWLAGNLRWSGEELLVVHDWDSAVADSEAVLVGFAAALYSTVSPNDRATIEETEVPGRVLRCAWPSVQRGRTPAVMGGRSLDAGL